ncbi:hypothetical protein [Sinomonas susongensis]|uniref:hypothetical protein n=1 Tax=Sinomonas susongensis TaxID=1324851 RepID=UPI001108D0DB|nr:hypothetical protein [Sinomonas susongensis]
MGKRVASQRWRRSRVIILALAAGMALAGGGFQLDAEARQQSREAEAQQLASTASSPASPTPAASASSAQPSALSAALGGSLSTPSAAASPKGATAPGTPAAKAPAHTSLTMPLTKFSWPAAGLSVNVVPLAWTPGETVDPPLDGNGFDPVAHWLEGTGGTGAIRPAVIAAHACHQSVPLCNDSTFPFNMLSYSGWAVGQQATVTDSRGMTAPCTLADRKLVDKSKAFSFANDPCDVVVFSCNFENPDGQVVLLTFRCGQCT